MIKKKNLKTHNEQVNSEAFCQALPDQRASDPTPPQQSLHPWTVPLTVQTQLSRQNRDAADCSFCATWLVQLLPFHTGAVSYVTHFMTRQAVHWYMRA